MLNYEIDPSLLTTRLPLGCELETWQNTHFVSVVGFQFLNTRVLGIKLPCHVNFEEVNLRFYVKRQVGDEVRRGVVFIKEIAPKRLVALVANHVYGENYVTCAMRHLVVPSKATYEWKRGGGWESVSENFEGRPSLLPEDSEESFISEHYWGYSKKPNNETMEYRVDHPRWQVWRAKVASLRCDVASLYGNEFAQALSRPPSTGFIADGSRFVVHHGQRVSVW